MAGLMIASGQYQYEEGAANLRSVSTALINTNSTPAPEHRLRQHMRAYRRRQGQSEG